MADNSEGVFNSEAIGANPPLVSSGFVLLSVILGVAVLGVLICLARHYWHGQ